MRKITHPQHEFYKRRMPELISAYPELFNLKFPKPLGIGITNDLVNRSPFTKKEISILLHVWCGRREYTMMAVSTKCRTTFTGELIPLTEEHIHGFVSSFSEIGPRRVKRFCKNYIKEFNKAPLRWVPIDLRPDLGNF